MAISFRHFTSAAAAAGLLAVLFAAPASAQYGTVRDHTLRVRAGLFEPDGESEYWEDTADLFTGAPEDFEDTLLGFDYRMGLGDHLALLVSASGYEGEDERHYLDFVDARGNEIFHDAQLDVTSLTAGLVLRLSPRKALSPYVGAGGGLYSWELSEVGDFIDFGSPGLDIFRAAFEDEGDTFGWYLQAGLEVNLAYGWGLFAEGRWHDAEDELGDDFEGFGDLDLSGREIAAGVAWTF